MFAIMFARTRLLCGTIIGWCLGFICVLVGTLFQNIREITLTLQVAGIFRHYKYKIVMFNATGY